MDDGDGGFFDSGGDDGGDGDGGYGADDQDSDDQDGDDQDSDDQDAGGGPDGGDGANGGDNNGDNNDDDGDLNDSFSDPDDLIGLDDDTAIPADSFPNATAADFEDDGGAWTADDYQQSAQNLFGDGEFSATPWPRNAPPKATLLSPIPDLRSASKSSRRAVPRRCSCSSATASCTPLDSSRRRCWNS